MPKFFSLGEVLLRLQTEKNEPYLKNLDVFMAGAAFNVAMGAANLGNQSSMISVVPDSFIGDQIVRIAKTNNCDTSNLIKAKGNMGIYFMEKGYGRNQSTVTYNRSHSVFADHTNLLESLNFGSKGDILHLTGITLLVSDVSYRSALKIVKKAKDKGMIISFDFNYRSKLADYAIAKVRYEKLLALSDIIFATKRDFTAILDWDTKLTERQIFEKVFKESNIKFIAHTNRSTLGEKSGLETIIHSPEKEFTSGVQLFTMIERVGGGDAFVTGVLDGFINNLSLDKTAKQANAMAILKQSIIGDFANISKEQLTEFINNYDSEVSR